MRMAGLGAHLGPAVFLCPDREPLPYSSSKLLRNREVANRILMAQLPKEI
jgi:hypothetical protein